MRNKKNDANGFYLCISDLVVDGVLMCTPGKDTESRMPSLVLGKHRQKWQDTATSLDVKIAECVWQHGWMSENTSGQMMNGKTGTRGGRDILAQEELFVSDEIEYPAPKGLAKTVQQEKASSCCDADTERVSALRLYCKKGGNHDIQRTVPG